MFLAGLAGVVHETLFSAVERPSLLVVFAGMMGLPAFLAADRRSKRNGNGKGSATSESDPARKG